MIVTMMMDEGAGGMKQNHSFRLTMRGVTTEVSVCNAYSYRCELRCESPAPAPVGYCAQS